MVVWTSPLCVTSWSPPRSSYHIPGLFSQNCFCSFHKERRELVMNWVPLFPSWSILSELGNNKPVVTAVQLASASPHLAQFQNSLRFQTWKSVAQNSTYVSCDTRMTQGWSCPQRLRTHRRTRSDLWQRHAVWRTQPRGRTRLCYLGPEYLQESGRSAVVVFFPMTLQLWVRAT